MNTSMFHWSYKRQSAVILSSWFICVFGFGAQSEVILRRFRWFCSQWHLTQKVWGGPFNTAHLHLSGSVWIPLFTRNEAEMQVSFISQTAICQALKVEQASYSPAKCFSSVGPHVGNQWLPSRQLRSGSSPPPAACLAVCQDPPGQALALGCLPSIHWSCQQTWLLLLVFECFCSMGNNHCWFPIA
jgi:hypothetical protein